MNKRALQVKVGMLVTVSVLILAGFIFILGNYSLGSGFTVYADFDFIGNLAPGAPVKISGIKMGRVESIEFMGGKYDPKVKRRVFVRLKLWINDKARETVRTDSKIFINTQGVLGEQYVEIQPGNLDSSDSKLLSSDIPLKGDSPPRSDLVVSRLYTFLDQATSLLVSEKDTIKKTLHTSSKTLTLVADLLEKNKDEISRLLKNGNTTLEKTAVSLDKVNNIMGDGKKIVRTIDNTNYLVSILTEKIPPFLDETENTLHKVNKLTEIVDKSDKDRIFSSLDKLDNLSLKLIKVADRSSRMIKNINSGKGSVGALMSKRDVYEDLKELIRDLRENPWKLFWKD